MKSGLVSFSIPTVLGCIAYGLATLLSRLFFSAPRHFYLCRLFAMTVFLAVIAFFCIPNFVSTGHPDHVRMLNVRDVGSKYGTMSVYVWLVFALIKRPKNETAA
jgi:hypothetical protein